MKRYPRALSIDTTELVNLAGCLSDNSIYSGDTRLSLFPSPYSFTSSAGSTFLVLIEELLEA
jgi:hypothetical protein